MRVLVSGATGYIGGRLIPALLAAGYSVRAMGRGGRRLSARFPQAEPAIADVHDAAAVRAALDGVEVAYYLIHSMRSSERDFAARDRDAASIFGLAAAEAGVKRIVYLGGLGEGGAGLSAHLQSRNEVGRVLRASGVPVTELRAAMIIGAGSASFEMMRYLTDRLPVMIAPKWVTTRCQPIAVDDVIAYLVACLETPASVGRTYDIGGADVLTYQETMKRYAAVKGLTRAILVVPFFTPRLSSYWVHLVTPIPASLARPLIDGLYNEVVVTDDAALHDFPIRPLGYDQAVQRALDRSASVAPQTTWFDAYDVRELPGRFVGVTQGMLIDRRLAPTTATRETLYRVFTGLGGSRGWLHADRLWELRGFLDTLVGGIGIRRGRRSPDELRIGDAVDFWRVEDLRPGELLRLRAEMKLPGTAWLQFEAVEEAGGNALRQTAFFDPRGIFGYLYWYAVAPFHQLIFGTMAARIAQAAESWSPVV